MWYAKRKKKFITDARTGQRIYLQPEKKARITGHSRAWCLGGCKLNGDPRHHHSGEEARYCDQLRLLKKYGNVANYEAQKNIRLHDSKGKPCGSHIVDFIVTYSDGRKVLTEYKGYATQEWRLKVALLSWCYPDAVYEVKTARDLI